MRNDFTRGPRLAIVAFGIAGVATSGFAADNLGKPVQATSTERFDFAPGGLIRIDHSFGALTVEAWDKPQVEVVVTRSLPLRFGESGTPDKDQARLDSIQVKTGLTSSAEFAVTTTLASRHGDWAPPLPANTTNHVEAVYELHVPRDSRLVIRHGVGLVQVIGVSGDIDATASRGDILLWLPQTPYAIDAQTKLGKVSSEFDGAASSRYLAGQRFIQQAPAPAHRLRLRMGFGGITIGKTLPESVAPPSIDGR